MTDLDLKQLKALISLCRKSGVMSIKCDGIELTLGDLPVPSKKNTVKAKASAITDGPVETDTLSPEALLFWSSGDITQQKLDEAARES